MKRNKEYIICAAWKRKIPRCVDSDAKPYHNNDILNIEIGYRHHDIYFRFGDELDIENKSQGFYTSYGRFVDRIEAMKIAYEAGQVSKRRAIYSEADIKFFNKLGLIKDEKAGDYKPLASEDLYCCSSDGNSMNE